MGVAAWECNRGYIFSPTKVNETQDVHRAIRVNFLGKLEKTASRLYSQRSADVPCPRRDLAGLHGTKGRQGHRRGTREV